jgi:hypothetical protein
LGRNEATAEAHNGDARRGRSGGFLLIQNANGNAGWSKVGGWKIDDTRVVASANIGSKLGTK